MIAVISHWGGFKAGGAKGSDGLMKTLPKDRLEMERIEAKVENVRASYLGKLAWVQKKGGRTL